MKHFQNFTESEKPSSLTHLSNISYISGPGSCAEHSKDALIGQKSRCCWNMFVFLETVFTRSSLVFSGYMHWNPVVAKLQLTLELNFVCFCTSNLFVYGNFYENSSVGTLPETFGWSCVDNFDYTNPYFEITWFHLISLGLWLVGFSCFILYYYWSKPLLLLFNSESFKIMLKKWMRGYALHLFTSE